MPKRPSLPVPTEHAEQVALIQWANLIGRRYPLLRLLHAIPNGGKRHIVTAKKLAAEGVRAGVPDLCLPVASSMGHHGLYLEMKRRHGSKISTEQQWWATELRAQNYCVMVCRGFDEARKAICAYLRIRA